MTLHSYSSSPAIRHNSSSLRASDSHCRKRFSASFSEMIVTLNTGNELLVLTAARELPQLALDDALRICLVLSHGDPERYEWAASLARPPRARGPGRHNRRATCRRGRTRRAPERATEAMELLQATCAVHGIV